MRLTAGSLPPILVAAGEHPAVHRAAADLAGDLKRVLGARPAIGPLGALSARAIVVGSLAHVGAAARAAGVDVAALTGDEACVAVAAGERLFLLGADRLGALWAVYRACELDLGVEPLHAWTHRPPARRAEVELRARPVERPAVALRGFFLNDEDLLSEWRPGGGERHIDYPFYRQVIAPEVLDRVLDAVVRLRCNLVIPASFVDTANPAEAALPAAVCARGLHYTQHHIEPVGVSHFALEAWARRRGEPTPSYVREPERVRACWREAIARQAVHGDQVVWAVGLRGRGDRPVWEADPAIAADPAARGALISRAMADQVALIREVTGLAQPTLTTVLWAEMADLHAEGHLRIPDGVVRVLCDHGPTQLWCADYGCCDRTLGPTGVYVHAAYIGDGPHLAAGVRPARLAATVGAALARGDRAYGLLNVGNLRETVLAASQVARAWWSGAIEDEPAMLARWWPDARLAAAQRALFDAYPDQGDDHPGRLLKQAHGIALPDPVLVAQHGAPALDGAIRNRGCTVLGAIDARHHGKPDWSVHGLPARAGASRQRALVEPAIARFTAAADAVAAVLPDLDEAERADAEVQLLVPARFMAGLARWFIGVCAALEAQHAGDIASARGHLAAAAEALDAVLTVRAAAATGSWAGWYTGDRKLDLPGVVRRTRAVAALLGTGP